MLIACGSKLDIPVELGVGWRPPVWRPLDKDRRKEQMVLNHLVQLAGRQGSGNWHWAEVEKSYS